MLHHFFEHHGFGESIAHLHADNCTGQNKNRFVHVACTYWPAQRNYHVVFVGRAHKVLTCLVLRTFQAALPKDQGGQY